MKWFGRSKRIEDKLDELRRIIVADAAGFQTDLDALKASVEAIPARVIAAIGAAQPLTQAQLDAADTEVAAIKAEADAVAPAAAAPATARRVPQPAK
jgi:hypothetical protein